MDAEKARADYARHQQRNPDHELRVGLDGFTGEVEDTNAQGVLFVSGEEEERQLRAESARLAAMKRARKKAAPAKTNSMAGWKPSGKGPRVSFEDLVNTAKLARNRQNDGPPGESKG